MAEPVFLRSTRLPEVGSHRGGAATQGGLGPGRVLLLLVLAAFGLGLRSWSDETPASPPTAEVAASPGVTTRPGLPVSDVAVLKREAVAAAQAAAAAYPDDPLTYVLLGSAHYNTGQSDEAAKDLRRCLELSPNRAEAYEVLSLIAYEQGKPEEAVRLGLEALRLGSTSDDVRRRLGKAYLDLGQAEDAVRILEESVRQPRPASESAYLLGQSYLQAGDPGRAKTSFLRAIDLLPDHTQAFFGAFTACTRLGQTNEAARYREQFQKLEALDRQTLTARNTQEDDRTGLPQVQRFVARTFFGAGQVHQSHGQSSQAMASFRQAAALDADSPTYRAALESVCVREKQIEAGVRAFEGLVAEQPGNSLNYYFLGRFYGRLERFEPAERCYRRVTELAPEWADGYRALAELYLRAGTRLAEARALARKAVELEPTGPNQYALAVASLRNNDRAGAIEAAKRALAAKPGEPRYQQLLQRLESSPE